MTASLSETPKGVPLKLDKGKYILLHFKFPDTGKRSAKTCNCTYDFTGIVQAVDKAHQVYHSLQRYSKASELWAWYDKQILGINEIENDSITYREIFKILEDKYFSGYHRNTKRKRSRDCISDIASCNKLFQYFSN